MSDQNCTIDKNTVCLEFGADGANESFARMAVAAFAARLNPTLGEIGDIKTVVSEAVTNAVIHGYNCDVTKKIVVKCNIVDRMLVIKVIDYGRGIENVEKAMEPMYTSRPELDRSGMGFSFMEVFTDDMSVESTPGKGTTVTMYKKISCGAN